MTCNKPQIYIGTVLMELNRWSSRVPSFLVSDWIDRFKNHGFDGIELWENHALMASGEEFKKLEDSNLPISIYNSYVNFDDSMEAKEKREKAAIAANKLKVTGVKFNFANEISMMEKYITNFLEWKKNFSDDCRILCECHPDTVLEVPEIAKKVFEIFDDERCQAIVHPFSNIKNTEEWFKCLGDKITHAHVSIYNDKWQAMRLKNNKAIVEAGLEVMDKYGFKGTYTIEFTEGIRAEDENINGLYNCAVDDLNYLRERI